MKYVSIIIAAYNSAPWISRCLDSVLTAADKSCEVVVVDDGSTDDTLRIIHEYEREDERVVVIESDHRGQGSARKEGFENSAGDWVLFVDSDDTLPPTAIADYRRYMSDEYDAIIANVMIHNGTDSHYELSGSTYVISPREATLKVLTNQHLNYLAGKLFRRQIIEAIEWDDHSSLTNSEDALLLLTISSNMTGNILVAPSIHAYNYILRPNSQSLTVYLRHEGMARMWEKLMRLDLPRAEFVSWGLLLIYKNFILRGLPLSKDYPPVRDLIKLSEGIKLSDNSGKILKLLKHPALLKLPSTRAHIMSRQSSTVGARVSFIVPVYKSFEKLSRTVKSIFATGFKNIEIVVVDDGCSKSVRYNVRKLYIGYQRIKIVSHNERRGLAASRLSGLRVASGDIFVFVDAGDMVCRDGLFEAFSKLDAGAEIVVLSTDIYNPMLHVRRHYFNPSAIFSQGEYVEGQVLKKILSHDIVPNSLWNVAMKRSAMIVPDSDKNSIPANRIGMYLRALSVDYVETPAYVWTGGHAVHRSLSDFWDRECQLTSLVINIPFSPAISLERKQNLVNGMTKRMVLGVARILSLPWKSKKAVLEKIKDNLNVDASRAIYESVQLPVPDAADVMQQAEALMRERRGEFMLRWLLRF